VTLFLRLESVFIGFNNSTLISWLF